eukprot:scaffold164_cov340-Pinguiococcus_pyrenoidosus.AAC.4
MFSGKGGSVVSVPLRRRSAEGSGQQRKLQWRDPRVPRACVPVGLDFLTCSCRVGRFQNASRPRAGRNMPTETSIPTQVFVRYL